MAAGRWNFEAFVRLGGRELKILGIGTVVVDHVVVLEGYPAVDTKSVIKKHWRQIGGPVPVALSVAAYYGATTQFIGRWGDDPAGREIADGLASRGIDLSGSSSSHAWDTGFAQVWTSERTGTRNIAFHRGSFPAYTAEEVGSQQGFIDQSAVLHLDGAMPEAALSAATRMKSNGGQVVLDAGSKKPGMEDLLPMVDVIVASDLFCQSWFQDANVASERIHELGPGRVIRTHAANGATYSDGTRTINSPALDIQPVDTNGAGDIFCGAILFGLTQSWSVEKLLAFANFVAGNACQHPGNSTYPDLDSFDMV